jgi:putative oxidoreductase
MNPVLGLYQDWGIFLVRITTGFLFAVHGAQKFAGGLDRVIGGFEKMGIPMPGVMGPFIAGLEVVGGILLIIGLATRWIGLLFAIEMLVATVYVKLPNGWNASDLERMLLVCSLLLFLGGAGRLAVDRALTTSDDRGATGR